MKTNMLRTDMSFHPYDNKITITPIVFILRILRFYIKLISNSRRIRRERILLASMSNKELKDIGVNRLDAIMELRRGSKI